MSNEFSLSVMPRQDVGKGASRRLRREADKIPGIIYGAGKEPVSITLAHNEIVHALENEAFYSHILSLDVAGTKEKVVLKDVQRHAYKPKIVHVDFLRVSADQKLTMNVPLHFLNEEDAPGVKAGGVVSHTMNDLEITCLPKDLPEFIEIDLINVEMDGVIHLTDIKLPKGVELVAFSHGDIEEHDLPVVSIHVPKVVQEAEPEEAESAEGEETSEGDSTTEDKPEDKKSDDKSES